MCAVLVTLTQTLLTFTKKLKPVEDFVVQLEDSILCFPSLQSYSVYLSRKFKLQICIKVLL